jgi:hypothetical protein
MVSNFVRAPGLKQYQLVRVALFGSHTSLCGFSK